MKGQLLVTAIGEDRPGIVARVTEVFVKHGANVEESRMAILGGEFAAIILVTVPDGKMDGLVKSLEQLKDETISVSTKSTQPLDPKRFAAYGKYQLTLNGADHEGIVHKVSRYLHDQAINIQSMDTQVGNAPVTGAPLFQMKAVILVPPSMQVKDLEAALNKIGNEEAVDIGISKYTEQEDRSTLKTRS